MVKKGVYRSGSQDGMRLYHCLRVNLVKEYVAPNAVKKQATYDMQEDTPVQANTSAPTGKFHTLRVSVLLSSDKFRACANHRHCNRS